MSQGRSRKKMSHPSGGDSQYKNEPGSRTPDRDDRTTTGEPTQIEETVSDDDDKDVPRKQPVHNSESRGSPRGDAAHLTEENRHRPKHGPEKGPNLMLWSLLLVSISVAILLLFHGLYYNTDPRIYGIVDAFKEMCDTEDHAEIGLCLKKLFREGRKSESAGIQNDLHDLTEKHHKKVMDRVEGIEKKLNELSENHKKVTERTEGIEKKVNELSENHKKVTERTEGIEKKVNDLSDNHRQFTERTEGIEKKVHDLSDNHRKLTERTEGIEKDVHDLTDNHRKFTERTEGIEKDVHDLTDNHRKVTERTEGIEKGMHGMSDNQNNMTRWTAEVESNTSSWIAAFETNTSSWVGSLDHRERSLEQLVEFSKHFNRETYAELFSKVSYQPLLMLLILGTYIWLLALSVCVKQRSPVTGHPASRKSTPESTLPAHPPPLEMNRSTTDVCVVGFHAETERTHLQTVRDICSKTDRAPKVLGFTVHGHKDLGSIPDAKVYIMFVDFNQSNIILEDPQKGLGDIRLETVRQLWRLGGDVILVYAGDSGSRRLEGNDLFNPDLTSIHHHAELSKLKNKERMLSMARTFTPYQFNHIKEIVVAKCR